MTDEKKIHIVDEKQIEAVSHLDKPKFDFSNVSYKAGRESSRIQVRIRHIAKQMDAATATDDIEDLITRFDALMDQQEMHIFASVTYVPQAWLITDAPLASGIDWRNSENIKWLRVDKLKALADAKNEAQTDSPN